MRALCHQLFLDGIGRAGGHRENDAVQAPVRIAILNGKRVDFCAEYTQDAAAAVGRSHTHNAHRLADRLSTVGAGNDVLNGSGASVTDLVTVDKMHVSRLNT